VGRLDVMVSSDLWDEQTAARYDADVASMFEPAVLDPVVAFLARLAGDGPALELAIGTGRVAVPLTARGVPVSGIELSAPMVAQLRGKVDESTVPVVVGDMATTRVPGDFALVYLVFNTIGNLRTQAEQVACFRNAAAHLRPGGRFVVEVGVPPLRRLPPGSVAVPFDVGEEHLGFDTFDLVTQQAVSHHYRPSEEGPASYGAHHYRYVWPSELDLMAQLAGMDLEQRHADWDGIAFTAESERHVSVWRTPG
jgi:SAM-dependent methyltransferase